MAPRVTFTAQEDALLRAAGYKARLRDLAAVTGRAHRQLYRRMLALSVTPRKRGQPCLALPALRRAWRTIQDGAAALSPDLDFWEQNEGTQGSSARREWGPGDDEALDNLAGYMPVELPAEDARCGGQPRESISAVLRRTPAAVFARLRKLGLSSQTTRYTAARLAKLLGVSASTVRNWIYAGHVRGWLQGGWWVVHADDAEWLCERDHTGGYRWADTDWAALRRDCPLPEVKVYKPREKAA